MLWPRAPRVLRWVVLFVACASPCVRAQTTGMIEGVVLGANEAPLPGSSIEARSPSLQGMRTVQSDAAGAYRIPALPPGLYTVRASRSGFTTVERSVRVGLSTTLTANFRLDVSAEEQVVVTTEAARLDLTSTATGSYYSSPVLRRLALNRNYADLLKVQAGVVSDTAEAQGRAAPLSIYGATSIENLYLIDGVNTNNVRQSFQGTILNPEVIGEAELLTGGYQAEYGRAVGGIINVITRSGGNEYHGDAFGYYNSRGMRADSKVNPDEDILASEQTQVNRWDAGADLGGAIVKDRLWFFGAYDRVGQTTDRIPGDGPVAGQSFPLDSASNIYSGKLTWNISVNTTVVGTVFGDPETRDGALRFPASLDPATFNAVRYLGGLSYAGRVNHILSSSGIASLQYSHHQDRYETRVPESGQAPRVTDASVPGLDVLTGGYGTVGFIDNYRSHRDAVSGSWTGYLGSHEVKVGGEYERNQTSGAFLWQPEATRVDPCKPDPYSDSEDRCNGLGASWTNFRGENVPGGVVFSHTKNTDAEGNPIATAAAGVALSVTSAYAQDTWRIGPRLTANVGLRWDHQLLENSVGETIVRLNNEWSPRLGLVWDFIGDGSSKAYASAGRFYYDYPTDLNFRAFVAFPERLFTGTVNFDLNSDVDDPAAPDFFNARCEQCLFQFAVNEPVDANLKGMYQDELTIGVEKALAPTFIVGVKGTYQRLGSVIEDRCDLDYLAEVNQGSTCAIINPGSDAFWASGQAPCANGNGRPENAAIYPGPADSALCNDNGGPPIKRAVRIYRAIELTARKSIGERFWAQMSYVYSSLRGNYDGAASLRTGQTDPGINADFDYWQFGRSNDYGKLYLDRPHAFVVATTWIAPFGLSIGGSGYVRSGVPRDQFLFFNEFYGGQIYGVPRGSAGRSQTQYDVNLALGYEWRLGAATVTPRFYVYQLLNRQAATRVENDFNPFGTFDENGNDVQFQDYGKFLERQDPRLFRLAVRISF